MREGIWILVKLALNIFPWVQLQLKDHLKVIKKKNGCNGTIKSLPNETNNGFIDVILLQGDHVDFVKEYLIKNDVLSENIKIKG